VRILVLLLVVLRAEDVHGHEDFLDVIDFKSRVNNFLKHVLYGHGRIIVHHLVDVSHNVVFFALQRAAMSAQGGVMRREEVRVKFRDDGVAR